MADALRLDAPCAGNIGITRVLAAFMRAIRSHKPQSLQVVVRPGMVAGHCTPMWPPSSLRVPVQSIGATLATSNPMDASAAQGNGVDLCHAGFTL